MEFKSFGEIKQFRTLQMSITQKIHGTNAQVTVFQKEDGELDLVCGSRTRFIYPHDDNYGFAGFVHANKEAFLNLGLGTHYGEWAGPGINSGEGLTEKTFVLFAYGRYRNADGSAMELPPRTVIVPVLYEGPVDLDKVQEVMDDLVKNGSKLVPGFTNPEGVVVSLAGTRYKKTFSAEESAWKGTKSSKGPKEPRVEVDFSHLLQPIRLEKLLSRDERYVRDFPKSLPTIVKDYVADLVKEGQITGTEDEVKSVQKGASKQIFVFVKETVEAQLNSRSLGA